MAFIEFSETAGHMLTASRPLAASPKPQQEQAQPEQPQLAALQRAAAQPAAPELTALEWRVVEIARGDGLATLQPQRKRKWLERFIFGPTPPSPMLADEKLEALRKLAVQAWHHGYTLPTSAMKHAILAGYSEWQVGSVIDAIVARRPAFRRVGA